MHYLSECDILVFKGYAVQVFKLLITAVFIGKLSDKRNDILLGVGFEVACIVIVCISRVMEKKKERLRVRRALLIFREVSLAYISLMMFRNGAISI